MLSDFLSFADRHWFLGLAFALIASSTVAVPFRVAFLIFNRWMRTRNIAAHGWPPAHLDADGDTIKGDAR